MSSKNLFAPHCRCGIGELSHYTSMSSASSMLCLRCALAVHNTYHIADISISIAVLLRILYFLSLCQQISFYYSSQLHSIIDMKFGSWSWLLAASTVSASAIERRACAADNCLRAVRSKGTQGVADCSSFLATSVTRVLCVANNALPPSNFIR